MNTIIQLKRFVLILLLLTTPLFAEEPGNILSYTIHPASVEIRCTHATIRITAYAEDIFRMDVKPHNVTFDPLPVPQLCDSLSNFTFQINDTPQTLSINSSGYSIECQKSPFSFLVRNASGENVLALENNGLQWSTDFSKITFTMQPNDHFYGFGEKGIDLDRRGHAFGMRNQAIYGYSGPLPEMNINIPFFFSLQGYGMYYHMSYPGYFDLGEQNANQWYYRSGCESWMQFFILIDDDPKQILKLYTDLTGRTPLPPAWAMGFLQSKYGYENEAEAREIVNTFRQKGIPLDALILDLFWFTNMGDFRWNHNRFPDPSQMIDDFLNRGVRTILITEPYVRTNSINYDIASNNGYFGQTSSGQTYDLPSFWFGTAALMDFTDSLAQSWWWDLYEPFVNQDVGGWWTDLCEPELHPDDMVHDWGEARRVHNILNLLWSKILHENYQQYANRRLFNLTRSGYAGSQRYGAITWSGDVARSFSGLAVQPILMQSMALSGMPFQHSDIGGFAGPPTSPELYARWMQFGVFCPITRPHSSFQSVEPWAFTPEVEDIAMKFIKLRESLFPYNYSYTYQASRNGLSIVRPLLLEYPDDPDTWHLGNQYLWGDVFLIAPILQTGIYKRNIYLPDGTWIDFWNETTYQGNQTVTVTSPLSRMPIFVKAGSVIPRTQPRDFILQYPLDTLLVDVYPADQGSFLLYEDDGQTLAYQDGEMALTSLAFDQSGAMLTLSVNPSAGNFQGQPSQRTFLYRIHLTDNTPDSVQWNGQHITQVQDSVSLMASGRGWTFQPAKNQLLILGDHPTSQDLTATVYGFSGLTEIHKIKKHPTRYDLRQNYPNPFNAGTTIEFELSQTERVSLVIYNFLGEELETLILGTLNKGMHRYTWDAAGYPTGIYVYQLKVGKAIVLTRKMVLLK